MAGLILEDNQGRIEQMRKMYPEAVIVETAAEAIALLRQERFDWVSLDHDLNNEIFVDSNRADCGAEVARFIAYHDLAIDDIIIHTANEGAARVMAKILAGYNVQLSPFEGAYDVRSQQHFDKYRGRE